MRSHIRKLVRAYLRSLVNILPIVAGATGGWVIGWSIGDLALGSDWLYLGLIVALTATGLWLAWQWRRAIAALEGQRERADWWRNRHDLWHQRQAAEHNATGDLTAVMDAVREPTPDPDATQVLTPGMCDYTRRQP